MAVSVPTVPTDTIQRRTKVSSASTTPSPIANRPSANRPTRSECATGPSITALVTSGTTMVATTPNSAKTTMRTNRSAYGRRYGRSRHNEVLPRRLRSPLRPYRRRGAGTIAAARSSAFAADAPPGMRGGAPTDDWADTAERTFRQDVTGWLAEQSDASL